MNMRELSIFVFAFGLVGCGSKNNTCVPGMSAACACSDGSMGAQSCRGDGTYGACACGTSATGGNGSGGAGGGGGGGSSGGSSNGNSGGGSGGGGGGGTGGIGGGGGASTGSKRVFVTSTAYAPTVATNICNTVAQSANLGGTWVAWLSHMPNASNMTGADAIDVVMGTGPWLLLNGHVAFANHAQLATMPSEPVSLTERMTSLPSTDDVVWTGTGNGGQASGYDCYDWSTMSTQYSASYGHATGVNDWTLAGSYSCQATAHVYCFEQ